MYKILKKDGFLFPAKTRPGKHQGDYATVPYGFLLAASYDPTADWDLFPDERFEDTHQKIINGRGALFDPVIVDAYIANRDAFEKVTGDTGLRVKIF